MSSSQGQVTVTKTVRQSGSQKAQDRGVTEATSKD